MGPRTSLSGWCATLVDGPIHYHWTGTHDVGHRLITLAELQSLNDAVSRSAVSLKGADLIVATRSTAALAVLRWVFPDAPFSGACHVNAPKKLGAYIQDAQCLYDLEEMVSALGIRLSLRHPDRNPISQRAAERARDVREGERVGSRGVF